MVMRPEADVRSIDVLKLGATTNRLIAKYAHRPGGLSARQRSAPDAVAGPDDQPDAVGIAVSPLGSPIVTP